MAQDLEEFLILSSLSPMISTNSIRRACSHNACLVSCRSPGTEAWGARTKTSLSLSFSTGIQAFSSENLAGFCLWHFWMRLCWVPLCVSAEFHYLCNTAAQCPDLHWCMVPGSWGVFAVPEGQIMVMAERKGHSGGARWRLCCLSFITLIGMKGGNLSSSLGLLIHNILVLVAIKGRRKEVRKLKIA